MIWNVSTFSFTNLILLFVVVPKTNSAVAAVTYTALGIFVLPNPVNPLEFIPKVPKAPVSVEISLFTTKSEDAEAPLLLF